MRKNIDLKYDPNSLFLKSCNYDPWFENEESINRKESVVLSHIPLLEVDKVKEEKGLKNLTPNKLLTRLPKLLVQIKPGKNS